MNIPLPISGTENVYLEDQTRLEPVVKTSLDKLQKYLSKFDDHPHVPNKKQLRCPHKRESVKCPSGTRKKTCWPKLKDRALSKLKFHIYINISTSMSVRLYSIIVCLSASYPIPLYNSCSQITKCHH